VHVAGTVSANGEVALFIDGKPVAQRPDSSSVDISALLVLAKRLSTFHRLLVENGEVGSYEASHTRLALECLSVAHARLKLLKEGGMKPLASPISQAAADQLYVDTAAKLANGLSHVLAANADSSDPRKQTLGRLWNRAAAQPK
jgi:hypothetical protein